MPWFWPVKKVAPLIEVRVSRESISHNVSAFRRIVRGREVFPVLKANAYGHGIIEVARILENGMADGWRPKWLCVDSYFEALQLRRARLKTPILVIGYSSVEQMCAARLRNVVFAVSDIRLLETLVTRGERCEIALEFDTGMHRHGIAVADIDRAAALVAVSDDRIVPRQLFSHLADADVGESAFTAVQRDTWNRLVKKVQEKTMFPQCEWFHLDATAGTAEGGNVTTNAVRLGLGLYGIDARGQPRNELHLRPVMSVVTKVVALRTVKKGEAVGYNATWIAGRDSLIATIPMGYHEGVDRRLSNKGFVGVHGKACPIVGRVSMNMTTIDVTDVPNVGLDDEVVVISEDNTQEYSAFGIARTCGTIPYDILVHIPAHLKRVTL